MSSPSRSFAGWLRSSAWPKTIHPSTPSAPAAASPGPTWAWHLRELFCSSAGSSDCSASSFSTGASWRRPREPNEDEIPASNLLPLPMIGPRLHQAILLLVAAALLFGVARVQESLNGDRNRLGLTRVQPLDNAPPVLAFTTVALGGFRGLISNLLWIRANDLQDDDKFFEAAQLADWITKLEPHFVQVWLVQAWNMAYNISVKFKDFPDRWRWVERGIDLLRDDGLRYNPNETLIYRELAWFFQYKWAKISMTPTCITNRNGQTKWPGFSTKRNL